MILERVSVALKAVILIDAGDTVTRAAERLGVGRPALSNVLNGTSELSPEMSARIDRVYECYTSHLLQAQLRADAKLAKEKIAQLGLKSRYSEDEA